MKRSAFFSVVMFFSVITQAQSLVFTDFGNPGTQNFSGVRFEMLRDEANTFAIVKIFVKHISANIQDIWIGNPKFALNQNLPVGSWTSIRSDSGQNQLRFYSQISNNPPALSDPNPGLILSNIQSGNLSNGRVDWSLLSQGGIGSYLPFNDGSYYVFKIEITKTGPGNLWLREIFIHEQAKDSGEFTYPGSATNTPVPTATNTSIPTNAATSTPTVTNTPVLAPTNTPVPVPTNTPVPLVPTNTPVPLVPTNTPVPVTPTATNTPLPANIAPSITIEGGIVDYDLEEGEILILTILLEDKNPGDSVNLSFAGVPVDIQTFGAWKVVITVDTSKIGSGNYVLQLSANDGNLTTYKDINLYVFPKVLPTNTSVPVPTNTSVPLAPTNTPTSVPVQPQPTNTFTPTATSVPPVPGNHPPIVHLNDMATNEGETLSFVVKVTDEDSDWCYLTAVQYPMGSSFITPEGRFTWTPTYEQSGQYALKIIATDEHGSKSEDRNIVITVLDKEKPTATPIVPPTATSTATNTSVPPTQTPVVIYVYPTPTATSVPPTATNVLPTAMPTATSVPQTATNVPSTATPTMTKTPVPPTATRTATKTPMPTRTAIPTPKPWNGTVTVLNEDGDSLSSSAINVGRGETGILGLSVSDYLNPMVSEFHVYLLKDGVDLGFIGKTDKNGLYQNNLEYGHEYSFRIFALIKGGGNYPPRDSISVYLLKEGETVLMKDGTEIGFAWTLLSGQTDYHIYVSEDGKNYSYLGRTGSGDINGFVWKKNGSKTSLSYLAGPQLGKFYYFRLASLDTKRKATWRTLESISTGGLLEPTATNTSIPKATATKTPSPTKTATAKPIATNTPVPPTATNTPRPTRTPVPLIPTSTPILPTATATPTKTATPIPATPSPTMIPWNDRAPWWNYFPTEAMTKWFRAGGWNNNPVWLARNAQVSWWYKSEASDPDGYAVLTADGSPENYPALFQYYFFVHTEVKPFIVIGMYTENKEGVNTAVLPIAGYRDKNKVMQWLAPAALPMPAVVPIGAFTGHFVTFDLREIYKIIPPEEIGKEQFVTDGIHFFVQGKNGASTMLLVDYVGEISFDEINMDVWSGHRAAVLEMFAKSPAAKFSSRNSLIKEVSPTEEEEVVPEVDYYLPSLKVLEKLSDGEDMNVINPAGYSFAE